MTPPLIDVLMTAYNAEQTVIASAESILNQSFSRLRLVIVNDGSTDATPALVDALAAKDARVVVLHQANSGIVNAAKAGLALCSAELIARQDADDLSFPQRLSRQVAHLRAHPDCVAVSGAAYHIDEHGRRTGFLVALDAPDKAMATSVPSREPYIMHPFMLARRDAMIAAGGYRDVEYAEDTDLCWRLLDLGRLDTLPEVVGEYRVHTPSVSSSSVVSGRISAINSQLSAISATRRRRGRPDLSFGPGDVKAMRGAVAMTAMLDLVAPRLDAEEAAYLRIASAAKLLELSLYRPYALDADDLCHLAATCNGYRGAEEGHLRYMRAEAATRLLLQGRIASARLLAAGLPARSIGRRLLTRAMALLPRGRNDTRALDPALRASWADTQILAATAARP